MIRSRRASPVAPLARWPLLLLFAGIALVGLAALEAHRAVQSHDAIARGTLRDYARVAAWGFDQHLQAKMGLMVRELLHPVNHGESLHGSDSYPDASVLVHYMSYDDGCGCHHPRFGPAPAHLFGFALGSDTLGVATNTHPVPAEGWRVEPAPVTNSAPPPIYSAAERAWINDTITAQVRSGFRSDWGFAMLVGDVAGAPRFLAYTLMPTIAHDTIVYGAEYDAATVRRLLANTLESDRVLPGALTAGRRNRDMVDLQVTDGHGHLLFGAVGVVLDSLAAGDVMPASYGAMRIDARIRPEMAEALIIGGLPRSRLPYILGLFALAAALSVVAIGQLRREQDLARLRTDFVSSTSHELRTPLAQIRLYLETLRLGRFTTEGERERFLEHIDRETQRLSHLVENVLRFSREVQPEGPAAPQLLDAAAEARAVVQEFALLAAARRSRIVATDGGAAPIAMRPGTLRQVLLNLIDNAVKYGPVDQTVTVRVARERDRVRVTVEDQGPGIATTERELVWQPFQRGGNAARSTGGSGIGLTIVREIVEEHGGTVAIGTAHGGGAAMTVELPLAVAAAAAPAAAPTHPEAQPAHP